MSAERLSRLQKWILVKALDHEEGRVSTRLIYQDYYCLPSRSEWRKAQPFNGPAPQHDYEATFATEPARVRKYPVVSASLCRLCERGLLERSEGRRFPVHQLTTKGREVALKLKAEATLVLRKDD